MEAKYRSLSANEITQLMRQGCVCGDWSKVEVAEGFRAERIRGVSFSGSVKLGVLTKTLKFPGGIVKAAQISNATIHNCTIGDEVYITNIGSHIANYVIEDNSVIENVDSLVVRGRSCFGNGTEVAVVNEAGGREIPIYDKLSSHTAYIMTFYRHRPAVIAKLRKMIADYTARVVGPMGVVGKGARLINCRVIRNVRIGPAAEVQGAAKLDNGSINSTTADHVHVGAGVVAEDFIISSGARVGDGVMMSKCFVGQCAILDKQYSAENSLFFANCECLRGEACSVFAGPFTVTHHKQTLLIAGEFSFSRTGSGTNQSNHLYKLGPVHQGIVERGCKTGSDAYILWPARIGAFSVVVGRHYGRPDTSDFPFSYLVEQNGRTFLSPGTALQRCGLVRDASKWLGRDRRRDPDKLDQLHFDILSPYTVQKVLKGLDILGDHTGGKDPKADFFGCPGVIIRGSMIEMGVKVYSTVVDRFLGDCIVQRLEDGDFENVTGLRKLLIPKSTAATGKWVDLGGLLAPDTAIQRILEDVENGAIASLERLESAYRLAHGNKDEYQWAWVAHVLERRLGRGFDKATVEDIIQIVNQWNQAVDRFGRLQLADMQREFTNTVRCGYGIDGDGRTKDDDFEAVRGTFEQNPLVTQIQESIDESTNRATELVARLEALA